MPPRHIVKIFHLVYLKIPRCHTVQRGIACYRKLRGAALGMAYIKRAP